MNAKAQVESEKIQQYKNDVILDYKIAYQSRQASLIGRKEVLTGKAKFGIFGDGKEIAQIAMAKAFKKGDFRSGYYRDQTFMFAKEMSNISEFFAQLYAHTDVEAEPSSAGRSMNGHFGTRLLDENGNWKNQTEMFNSTSDISPTAGQMPRSLGIAVASKIYRENKLLTNETNFSNNGNEVSFVTIGNASTSEGPFWETVNAACVMQVPLAISIWDDEYGISVHAKYQTAKQNLSAILSGFATDENGKGLEIFKVKGWDYPELVLTYQKAIEISRTKHTPVLIHVTELTQPQGHSTSGSHERYKSVERLEWEKEFDCLRKMREWMLSNQIVSENELNDNESIWRDEVNTLKKEAWNAYQTSILQDRENAINLLKIFSAKIDFSNLVSNLSSIKEPQRREIAETIHQAKIMSFDQQNSEAYHQLSSWLDNFKTQNKDRYSSHLYSQSSHSVKNVEAVDATYDADAKMMDGREIMNACFEAAFERNPKVFAFGEDVGKIGDVNQGFAGLQDKFGEVRVTDKGIRELTIIGEGIGASMRGLRPIAEIQYLDYLLYAIQVMSDDIATMQWRTKGGQKAPIIIRTRGHRLEGVWHSGSPMGMIINAVRGIQVCVPRNMTQAAGFYNTLLESDEPALVIECLNGYRTKEKMPNNIGEFKLELGIPETLIEGSDVTLVSYGSTLKIAEEAIKMLTQQGVSVELIDVQTLLPFDINHKIVESLKKTNRLICLDEDVPGGASAFMLQHILEKQQGYKYLDAVPTTISAKSHRPAYGTDGDYFSKPNTEDIFDVIWEMMKESDPEKFEI